MAERDNQTGAIDKSGRRPTRGGGTAKGGGGGTGLAFVGMILGLIALGSSAFAYIQVGQVSETQAKQTEQQQQKLEMLEDQLASVNKVSEDALGALRARMKKAVEQTENQLAQIDSEGILINTRSITKLAGVVNEVRGQVAGATKDIPQLDKRIKTVNDNAASGLSKLQGQMQQRTDTLDVAIKKSAQALDTRTKSLDSTVSSLKVDNGKLTLRMDDIEKTSGQVLKKLNELSYEVDNFDDSAVEKLNTRMDTLARDYDQLQQSIRKVQQDMIRFSARSRAGGN